MYREMLPHAIVLLHLEGKPRVSWGHIRGYAPRPGNCPLAGIGVNDNVQGLVDFIHRISHKHVVTCVNL